MMMMMMMITSVRVGESSECSWVKEERREGRKATMTSKWAVNTVVESANERRGS